MSMMDPSPTWLRERAIEFVAIVTERGMTMTVDAAEVVIGDRTRIVAEAMGISVRAAQAYLDDVVLTGLADAIIDSLNEEDPGVNLFEAPRTVTVTVSDFGVLIAGIAETILLYTDHPAIDDDDRTLRRRELVQLLSVCGLIQSEHSAGDIPVPPALLARMARTLEVAAGIAADPDLAAALRRDAVRARECGSTPS